jgi:hypothetical protein
MLNVADFLLINEMQSVRYVLYIILNTGFFCDILILLIGKLSLKTVILTLDKFEIRFILKAYVRSF